MEILKQEGTSHSTSGLLKICEKMWASWSAQVLGLLEVNESMERSSEWL